MYKPSGSVSSHAQAQKLTTSLPGDVSSDLSINLSHEKKKDFSSDSTVSAIQPMSPVPAIVSPSVTEPIQASSVGPTVVSKEASHVTAAAPKKTGFFGKTKNFFKKPFNKLSGSSKTSSTPSLWQKTKSKVGSIFSRKKDVTPSIGKETIAVGNKNFEIRHGKWYNKILANTTGRIFGILTHAFLTLKPWQGLQNPNTTKIKDILSRYSNVNWDTDHTIYLGHTDRWDQIKKMFAKRKGFGNFIQNLGFAPILMSEGMLANFSRADHYNPVTKSITLYSPNEWIAAHELGHAEDFAQKWDFREYEKRLIPIYGTLLTEKNASTNAISRTKNAEEKKNAEKVLYPAFGSYIGGIFALPFIFLVQKLGRLSDEKSASISSKISSYVKKFFTYIFPLPIVAGMAWGHVNARLPKRWKWKIFDKSNKQTSGDTNQVISQQQEKVDTILPTQQVYTEDISTTQALTQQLIQQDKDIQTMQKKLQITGTSLSQRDKEISELKQKLDQADTQTVNNSSKKEEVTEKQSSLALEKEAARIKDHIQTLLPPNYTTHVETPGGFQRIVISDPAQKEDPNKPTFYLTPTKDDKLNIHYSPLDSHGEVYYHGSLDISDTENIDACLSLVLSAMQGEVTDMDVFATDLAALGLEKKVTKKDAEPADIVKKNKKKKPEPTSA